MRPAPGRHPLPREFIARHQRARIIAALAAETAEKGYRAVTVADVVRRAGIARNTFYENFACKDECFLATAEFALEAAMSRVVEAAATVESWPSRVNAGLAAFLNFVAAEPDLARLSIVDALAAGPASIERS
jgi:AcrR family transcriptional regulator